MRFGHQNKITIAQIKKHLSRPTSWFVSSTPFREPRDQLQDQSMELPVSKAKVKTWLKCWAHILEDSDEVFGQIVWDYERKGHCVYLGPSNVIQPKSRCPECKKNELQFEDDERCSWCQAKRDRDDREEARWYP